MRELTATELNCESLDWKETWKGGHYPIWAGLHRVRCLLDHQHKLGEECCHPGCWCRQEPLKILGQNSGGPSQVRAISHMPHPLCEIPSWHPYTECRVCCDEDGPHPIRASHPGGGQSYTSSLMEPKDRGPKPKAEDKLPETDPIAEIETEKERARHG